MRPWKWICSGALLLALFLGLIIYPYAVSITAADLTKVAFLVEAMFMLQLACAMWMVYQALRYESKPLPYVLLALFVPFAAVWYYLERITAGKRPQRW
jgi:hypothetical protein